MAYAQTTPALTRTHHGGRKTLKVTFAETGATSTDEWSVQMPSPAWRLVSYKATKTSGTATTINPKLGKASGWTASTQDDMGLNSSTAAHINDQTELLLMLEDTSILYGVSQTDGGSTDNAISTELVFVQGLQP